MPKLCRVDIAQSQELLGRVTEFAERLRKDLPVQEVFLFGSFARGEIHEGSDIDLLIVGDFTGRIFDRIGAVLDMTELPIEPLVYTPAEFDSMKASGNPFIAEVLKTAVRLV